ncbi:MAG: hypothetical protein WCR23_00960 [Planctomycetota bacterium]
MFFLPILRRLFLIGVLLEIAAGSSALAEDSIHTHAVGSQETSWLSSLKGMSDAIEWSDQLVCHDWRLQSKPFTDSWRLLDPENQCCIEGSRDDCMAFFRFREEAGLIPSVQGSAVLVLHGLGQGRGSMRPLVEYLRKHSDATIMNVGYASPKAELEDHARSLGLVIHNLPKVDRLSFVTHSLGTLVVRRWMSMASPEDLKRLDRMVMLGAPNQGSELARIVSRVWFLSFLADGAAREMVVEWKRISDQLAIPPCSFGIIAGGRGDNRGFSPLLTGDDDAIVRVAETHLAGADDFLLLPVHHADMMRNPQIQEATMSFLKTGSFTTLEDRKEIEPATLRPIEPPQ